MSNLPSFTCGDNSLQVVVELDLQAFIGDFEDHGVGHRSDLKITHLRDYGKRGFDQRLLSCENDTFAIWIHDKYLYSQIYDSSRISLYDHSRDI